MVRAFRYLFSLLARFVFWLRYDVHVEGREKLGGLARTLILPNHPAYIDPPLVLSALWETFEPRPLLFVGTFQNPVLFWIPRLLRALEIPNLEQHSAEARGQAERAIAGVVESLRRGENVILWPSGHVQRGGGVESLGAARSVAEILRQVPDANVVGVRTCGLSGSMFSYARTGTKPRLVPLLFKGLGLLLANLVFFTPRRRVNMTLRRFRPEELPERTREALNPFLEQWYNEPGPEQPVHVPYHFLFGARAFKFPAMPERRELNLQQVKPEVKTAVSDMLAEKVGDDRREALRTPETTLDSLGLDSLDRMELSLSIEQRFGFSSDVVPATVGDFWALAQGLMETAPPKPAPAEWFGGAATDEPLQVPGDTIPEAFVRRALANPGDTAVADDLSGALTYERLLTGALVMSRRFEAIGVPNVGLMLPASVAAELVFLGIGLAGKVPVLMNWTTGPANLAHAARVMGLTHIVTSRRFVDRLAISVEDTEYLFLEDLRAGIGKLELLGTLLRVRYTGSGLASRLPRVEADATAAVLFTSGSEKAPKAVPLTHRNIISNIKAALQAYHLTRQDSLLGFLPIFHSFGLTVTGLLPILGGARVVYHPDPTDASALVRKIASYRPTIVCGTPTFISYIAERADAGQLESLRLIVVGAEKCPLHLFERLRTLAPNATLIEGFGISECSPLVSANRIERNRPGSIGLPLPGIEVRVVDPDTFEPKQSGELGMLLVSGSNVFPGYIGFEGPPPFREVDGKRYYVTGDLATIDEEGFVWFRGRLKRFLKAGGEMISLPALEEPLARKYPPTQEGVRVAVEGIETPSGRRIVLFTTEPVSLREANELLALQGLRGIMRIDEVRRVEHIPVLGTGKTDYKVLRQWIEHDAVTATA